MIKVLFVEDDVQILKSLSLNLKLSGYEVKTAETVASAWSAFEGFSFDLILLDVNLPDGTGLDFCRRIRETGSEVPVLFLSARVDEETVVEGMNIGGDDYIRKPFGVEELKARMTRALKHTGLKRDIVRVGPLVLDAARRLAAIDQRELSLGKREFDILMVMARKAGDVVTRDTILTSLDEKADVYDRTIDSHMSHLRKKMRETAGDLVQIAAVYGVGYRLEWKT